MKNLLALGMDVFACDPQAAPRRAASTELGIETLETLGSALARRPDACVVAAPTALHMQVAGEAAAQGCHLFIEKPLSHSTVGVKALLARVKQNNLVTLVGCNMRFHPGLASVKRLIDAQAVGRVIAARVDAGQYLPDWHPREDYRHSYSARSELGGGVILDAIHEIDYVRWLVGEVAGAFCLAGKLSRLEIDTEDTAAIVLRFENGALGEVHLDYVQRAYHRTCQIIGEEGTLHWDYTSGQVRWYSAQSQAWQVFADPPGWEPNQMYVDEMKHFLRCLDGVEQPALDVFEAAQVLRVALAAKESAREQRWIELRSQNWNRNVTL
jgi:predicted dehydrogenase